MLERLNGNEKGDAIVSVRGYEPIWTKFTPSYELKEVYFAAGKADIGKREARLFDKNEYVFDILGGSLKKEEERLLEEIDGRDNGQAEEEKKQAEELAELNRLWEEKVKEVHTVIFNAVKALREEDAAAILKAKLEDKLTLIRLTAERYADEITTMQNLQALIATLEKKLPELLELQERAKGKIKLRRNE